MGGDLRIATPEPIRDFRIHPFPFRVFAPSRFRDKKSYQCICALLAMLWALACSGCGPHMKSQPNIKPYERAMPIQPAGTTPTHGRLATLTQQQSKLAANPLPANATNLRNGKIYYGYYCLMCHGDKGDGNGPVGQSYVPKPADLSSRNLASINDGELYRRMLHGEGHDLELDQTVQPAHRWPLVLYVRTFNREGAKGKGGTSRVISK